MRVEIQTLTDEISKALNLLKKHVGWADAKDRLEDFNRQAESSDLWDDPKSAQILMRQRQELEAAINNIKNISTILEDNIGLIELGEEEKDEQIISEAEAALKELSIKTARMQVETLLCGEADANDCYLEVHSGAGGTESQDWASMLLRMYTRWAERNKMKVENIEVHYGDEAGIKSVTILIKGHNAYGWLKTES
ncbi:MAG: PCRF domain-containing protein, partial [Devosiaceae bacterium]|nr:PCRF domain-containing protein [Devosiaceae bacterium]